MTIEGSSKRLNQDENWQINFSTLDADIVKDNGNDLIAILAVIGTYLVERIMVDDESAMEVLMWEVFKGMDLNESLLRPVGSIYGFVNQLIQIKGLVTLPVTLDQRDHIVTKITNFIVVDQPSAYNAIIE